MSEDYDWPAEIAKATDQNPRRDRAGVPGGFWFRSDDFAAFPALPERASAASSGASTPKCLAYEAGAEALPLWEEIRPAAAMNLVGPLAGASACS